MSAKNSAAMEKKQDFIIKEGVLAKYAGPGGDVVIPDGVTEIGKDAFIGCKGLTGVTIPEGTARIGERAFGHCSGLTGVALPESVTRIDMGAFMNSGLTGASIPKGVTEIDVGAFSSCTGLASVDDVV